jgi:uncharacterized membrane protein YdbT with pleckstrin-like domain
MRNHSRRRKAWNRKYAFAFVGWIILAPIIGYYLGFFNPCFNSTFTILVISILLGVGLGYAYHCLMKWLPEDTLLL